jgi:hypothetical protein
MDFYVHGDAAPDGRFNYVYTDSLNNTTGINEQKVYPNGFSLSQNYPNPFNPSTVISYSISKLGLVTLRIYGILGKEVATLVNREQTPGNYSVNFNASNLSSGIYFYRLESGSFISTKKMILLK